MVRSGETLGSVCFALLFLVVVLWGKVPKSLVHARGKCEALSWSLLDWLYSSYFLGKRMRSEGRNAGWAAFSLLKGTPALSHPRPRAPHDAGQGLDQKQKGRSCAACGPRRAQGTTTSKQSKASQVNPSTKTRTRCFFTMLHCPRAVFVSPLTSPPTLAGTMPMLHLATPSTSGARGPGRILQRESPPGRRRALVDGAGGVVCPRDVLWRRRRAQEETVNQSKI